MSDYVETTIRLERERILTIAARVLRPTEYDLLRHAVERPSADLSTSEGQATAIRAALGMALRALAKSERLREAEASVAIDLHGEQRMHYQGDDCPGGHW